MTNSQRESALKNEGCIWVYNFNPLVTLCLYYHRTWVWTHGRESYSSGVQKEEGVEPQHPFQRQVPNDLTGLFSPLQLGSHYFSVTLKPGDQAFHALAFWGQLGLSWDLIEGERITAQEVTNCHDWLEAS